MPENAETSNVMDNMPESANPWLLSYYGIYRDVMQAHIRSISEGTNINKKTLLTTDYLNHFSSIIMLLEIFPSAPDEIAEDVLAWSPLSYEEHFLTTGFRDKTLAIIAYQNAPNDIRTHFDTVIGKLQNMTEDLMDHIRGGIESGDTQSLGQICMETIPHLRELVDDASAIANGTWESAAHDHAGFADDKTDESNNMAQSNIDALF